MRVGLVTRVGVALVLATLLSVQASAQTLVDEQPAFEPRIVVAVPPFRIYADPTLDVADTGLGSLSMPAIRAAIETFLDADPRWTVPERGAGARLAQLARDDVQADVMVLARQAARLGIGNYQAYHLATAVGELRQAVDTWSSTPEPWLAPDVVADAWLYLALAWHARAAAGDVDPTVADAWADAAFREMIRLDPVRTLDRDTWPASVVDAWQAAYLSLLIDGGRGPALRDAEARWLVERLDVDAVAWGWVTVDASGAVLHLQVWDRATSRFVLDTHLPAPTNTAVAVDAIAAPLSTMVACTAALAPIESDPVPRDAGTTWLGVGPTSAMFLRGPTRRRFLHVGVQLDAQHMVSDFAGVYGTIRLMTSTADAEGDLISRIDTQRFEIGGQVSWRSRRARLYSGGGFELARIGAVRATRSFWCKVSQGEVVDFGDGRSCDEADIVRSPGVAQAGVALRVGGELRIAGPVWLDARVSTSLYFAPVSDRELDVPVTMDLGIAYRF